MKLNTLNLGVPYLRPPKQLLLIMKLTTFILMIALAQVSAMGFGQTITLNEKNTPIEKVLLKIRQQSGYEFIYDVKDLKGQKVSLKLTNASIEEAVKSSLEDLPLTFTILDKNIVLKKKEPSFIDNIVARFQAIDVRGRIVDEQNQPLPGATITVKGKSQQVKSDAQGNFFMQNVDEKTTLVISYVGYISKEVNVRKELGDLVMQLTSSNLDDVQVIGYGLTTRKLNPGNVVTVRAADIEKQPVTNPLLTLQGRAAGVEINQINGITGGAVKVNIRGINTLRQRTDPLYVIDGVPYNPNLFNTPGVTGISGTLFGGSSQNAGLNPLSLINPQDIESISILKDADATAIYGSRAANGVILITTKKGVSGPTKLDLNVRSGFCKVSRRAEFMGTADYLTMRKEAFTNDNEIPTIDNAPDLLKWSQNAYTDWQEKMIGGTSNYTDAQLSLSGGTENTQFLLGGNYRKATTVFPGDWNDVKTSVHFNLNNSNKNQRFRTMLSVSFLADNNELPDVDFTRFINLAPNAPSLYNPDGSINWLDFPDNPFRSIPARYTGKTNNLIANGVLSYELLPGLTIKSSLGYNWITLDEKKPYPTTTQNPADGIPVNSASFVNNAIKSWIIEPQINYSKQLGRSKFDVLFAGTIQNRNIEGQEMTGAGYSDDALLSSLAGATTIYKGSSVFEQYRYNSILGRITYNWEEKYLINLTGRRDGSSRFGPGKQFGNFGAIGATWIISSEPFFKRLLPTISFSKLRGSYGTSGNEPGTNYAYLELYNFTTSMPYAGGGGVTPANLPVPDYRWEINKKAEIGLEMGLLDNRIDFSVSYYRNRSSNQLLSKPMALSVGFANITANIPATIENKGWEFVVNSTNLKTKKFDWKSSFNLTIAKNKLVNFPELATSGFQNAYIVGEPVTLTKIYNSAGIDQTTGLYQFYDVEGKVTLTPQILDQTGFVNTVPKFFGGFQNTLSYGAFTLGFNLQYVKQTGRNYLFSLAQRPGSFSSGTGQGNQPLAVLDRWQNSSSTSKFQKFSNSSVGSETYAIAGGSNLAFSDASFVRMKNAYFSYELPENLYKRLKLQRLRVYMEGQNLFTVTGYKGADPETQNIVALPPLRVITIGIQLTL